MFKVAILTHKFYILEYYLDKRNDSVLNIISILIKLDLSSIKIN